MLVGRYNKTPATYQETGVLKQRLPPNSKGADEGPCASNRSMTEQLNAVNYLRLPFFLRSGLGGLVRNNCTVST